jgi:putative transcriptional regulator
METKLFKKLRAKKNLTQEAVARRVGLTYKYYQALEQGKYSNPTAGVLIKLAELFEVSLDELVGRKIPKKK